MRYRKLLLITSIIVLAVAAWAELPRMKMTTPIPEGVATPDNLETSIGTLTSFDGVPDAEALLRIRRGTHG